MWFKNKEEKQQHKAKGQSDRQQEPGPEVERLIFRLQLDGVIFQGPEVVFKHHFFIGSYGGPGDYVRGENVRVNIY